MITAPVDDRIIHFIGLGGIGVSGLAEILHDLGYTVQGSDQRHSQNIERLERLGVLSFVGHDAKHVENVGIVVYSSAITNDNVELKRARELKIPCLPRAEMLSQIVRFKKSIVVAGSHGKTTVTSICATILEMAGVDPMVVNGGVINSYKTNARLGAGEWAIIESDESDGSFVRFQPTIGVVTNIDKEHIGHYGSIENLRAAFGAFLGNLPFYGAGVVCIDDDNVREIVENAVDRKIVTYAIKNDAMVKAVNIRKSRNETVFDIEYPDGKLTDVAIPILGDHNILNSLAAFAVASELSVEPAVIRVALASFGGVERRFAAIGEIDGVLLIDDYAHHPTEIRALLQAARQGSAGKIAIVCQPHRISRLTSLFEEFCTCFDEADTIVLTPVYRANDTENEGKTTEDLICELKGRGLCVAFAGDKDELERIIKDLGLSPGDMILFAGAGSISRWAREIYAAWLARRATMERAG